jgi:hypothetical protein
LLEKEEKVSESYLAQLKWVWARGRTKAQLKVDATTVAAEADKWRNDAKQLEAAFDQMKACCDRAHQLVRDLLADSHKRNDRLAAKLGLANLADDDEPTPETPPTTVH